MDHRDDLIDRLQRALGDGFTIERELTRGGMSRLFFATDRSLNRPVVVKVLPPEAMDGIDADRFSREAALLARLQHPHIVPVLAAGRGHDVAYYVMPYVEGESLAIRLAREGPADIAAGVALLREIADALSYAHSQGVVHRDVKPANVLLAAGHAVVSDFGIAHVDGAHVTKLTATGLGLGTIGYMAPEQIVGASTVDARADVFALGVVGYELLTGRSPFATSSASGVFAPQLRARPAHPRTIRAEIPVAVGDALLKAIESDPHARFATMGEFRQALDLPSAVVPARRRRRAIAAGAVVLAVGAAIASIVMKQRADRAGATTGGTFRPSGSVDDSRMSVIAVAPFDVLRGDLGLWREGMIDILSRNLDGMGDLRTISATTILQAWHGRADAASAAALGKAVKAGVVIYGALRGDRDSVRAVATLYDVAKGQPIADVERRDAVDRIDRLADSLTVELVRALGAPRGGRGPHLGSVGTRSMPALKAFLQGEQYFRRSAYDSADAMFRRAAEIDTGFALAYHGQARALGWLPRSARSLAAARAAVARNHGLSEHDSLSIVCGAASVEFRSATTDRGPLLARAIALVKQALEKYPADGEMRYVYGDLVFHNPSREVEVMSARDQLDLFDSAIAADSGLGEAYAHALQLAVGTRDVPRLQRYLAVIEEGPRTTGLARWAAMIRWFTPSPGRTSDECRRWADTVEVSPRFAFDLYYSGATSWVDSAGSVARCVEILAQRRARSESGSDVRVGATAATLLRGRGLLRRASALDPRLESSGAVSDLAMLAMVDAFDADSAAEAARPVAADSSAAGAPARAVLWQFWSWRRDTSTLAKALTIERRRRAARSGFSPAEIDRIVDVVQKVLYSLVAGDTTTAIRAIETAPHLPNPEDAALRGSILPTLYERRGRLQEARALLERFTPYTTPLHAVLRELHIGRLSEQLHDPARAAKAYAVVVDAFAQAEPAFARFRREALDGLRRTSGDTREGSTILSRGRSR